MTASEAAALLGIIEAQSCLKPETRQIGNGEFVVIVNKIWLWSLGDWEQCKPMWRLSLYALQGVH
jgi:hypothetical protein